MANSLVNNFEIPSWAGKPPPGLHLDVMKDTKMVQKLMIDEKKCYFFGRNKQMCDFCIDHASCSRVHSALIWHRHLARPFIIDLGSTHGTYIGHIRLDKKKPQAVPIDSELSFGASTRRYVIRERPQPKAPTTSNPNEEKGDDLEGSLLGLPETEGELDNLTEFNTAHNRRITALGDIADMAPNPRKRKRRNSHVRFKEEDEVINPEDIDPSIGRFRNMVQTTVIPAKRPRLDSGPTASVSLTDSITKRLQSFPYSTTSLYEDEAPGASLSGPNAFSIAAKLGLRAPNLAPEVEDAPPAVEEAPVAPVVSVAPPVAGPVENPGPAEPKKKKYAKEAWPGKKPTHSLFG